MWQFDVSSLVSPHDRYILSPSSDHLNSEYQSKTWFQCSQNLKDLKALEEEPWRKTNIHSRVELILPPFRPVWPVDNVLKDKFKKRIKENHLFKRTFCDQFEWMLRPVFTAVIQQQQNPAKKNQKNIQPRVWLTFANSGDDVNDIKGPITSLFCN